MKTKSIYRPLILATAMLLGAIGVTAQTYVKTFTFKFDPEDFELSGKEEFEILPDIRFTFHYGEFGTPALLYLEHPILIPDNYRMKEFTYSLADETTINQVVSGKDTLTVGSITLAPTPSEHSGPGPFPEVPDYPLITYPAEVAHTGKVRCDGYKPEMFEINPFTYHAADRKLVLATSITLTVTIEPDNNFKIPDGRDDDAIKDIKYYVHNPEDVESGIENWMPVSKSTALDGKQWKYSRVLLHIVPYVYEGKQWIDGDTLVDGKLCKKLYTLTTTEDERIEQKEVLEVGYCRQEGDKFYKNGVLMFDFGLKEGEIFSFEEDEAHAIVTHVTDTILTDGITRKCLTLRTYLPEEGIIAMSSGKWIEGIGSLKSGIYDNMFMNGGYNTTLLSCTHNNTVIYEYENSKQINTFYPEMPQCNIRTTGQSLLCTAPNAVKLEVYTMDAVKVGEARFVDGEATVKVGGMPATYLYIVTYPDGQRESGKTRVSE